MRVAEKNPFKSLLLNSPSFIREILQKDSSVASNAAIVVFTSSSAVVLPVLLHQPPGASGIFGIPRSFYSAFVVCLMFAFACAFTSMVLLPKRPKASRLLHISAAFWLSSAFTLLFSAVILETILNGSTQA